MTLALEFRPHRFADVVGQGHVVAVLKAMVRTGRVPPALLFAGSRGTGKTSMARILAAALTCRDRVNLHGMADPGDGCGGMCDTCQAIREDRSLALLEVDAASNGGVDDIRRLRTSLLYDVGVDFRVVVLDEAHMLSRAAFNALLRVLEEPPPNTTLCLLTTEPERIPDTVTSRSMLFEFRRIPLAGIVQRLADIAAAKGLAVDARLLQAIAQHSEGGMRDAVMKLDQCSYVNVTTVEGFRELFGIYEVGVPLLKAALIGDYAGGMKLIDEYFYRAGDATAMVANLVEVMRDLILRVAGAQPVPSSEEDARVALAKQMSLAKLVAAVRTLWELKGRVRSVDDGHRVQMEMAFVVLTESLYTGPIQMQEAVPAREEPLTSKEQFEELVASLTPKEATRASS